MLHAFSKRTKSHFDELESVRGFFFIFIIIQFNFVLKKLTSLLILQRNTLMRNTVYFHIVKQIYPRYQPKECFINFMNAKCYKNA